jgi:hypothetical protein
MNINCLMRNDAFAALQVAGVQFPNGTVYVLSNCGHSNKIMFCVCVWWGGGGAG